MRLLLKKEAAWRAEHPHVRASALVAAWQEGWSDRPILIEPQLLARLSELVSIAGHYSVTYKNPTVKYPLRPFVGDLSALVANALHWQEPVWVQELDGPVRTPSNNA